MKAFATVLLLLLLAILAVSYFAGNDMLRAHTVSLFAQLGHHDGAYASIHGDSSEWAEFSDSEYMKFIDILENRSIDWNSCATASGKILDGWSHDCRVKYKKNDEGIAYRYSSRGRDAKWGTDDDITATYNTADNAAPQP